MNKIDKARLNCAAALQQVYKNNGLLADMLRDDGQYRAYWKSSGSLVLESECDNIFDTKENIRFYPMEYIRVVDKNMFNKMFPS